MSTHFGAFRDIFSQRRARRAGCEIEAIEADSGGRADGSN